MHLSAALKTPSSSYISYQLHILILLKTQTAYGIMLFWFLFHNTTEGRAEQIGSSALIKEKKGQTSISRPASNLAVQLWASLMQNSSMIEAQQSHPSKASRHSKINTATVFNRTIVIGCKLQSNYTSIMKEPGSHCQHSNNSSTERFRLIKQTALLNNTGLIGWRANVNTDS